jgi:benzoyl-CoA reductase/2-hydroxyglutaryl-CoA dehydratase subunit BcrC/BadD/HgdB
VAAGPEIAARHEVMSRHRQQGGQIAAVLPVYAPRALLRAYGFLPVEVWGPPGIPLAGGASHLQPYVCSIVRNALSFLLSGGLDATDIVLVPHACDSLQGLGSILLDFVKPRQPVLTLYLPRHGGGSAGTYLAAELQRLAGELQAISGRAPGPSELLAHVTAEEEADGLLAQLHSARRALPLGNVDFFRLTRSREYLPLEPFMRSARQALALHQESPFGGKALLISGVVPEPMQLLQALDERGARIVTDDLLCGLRRLCPPGRSRDPFVRLAESWQSGPPDSTRGSSLEARREYLLRLVETSGAQAVVFHLVKFCEPELFYMPSLRKALLERGIPSVVIEVDLNDELSQQSITRLDALLEMIP